MFKQKPICEECGKNEATSFSFFPLDSDPMKGEWKFVCDCTIESEDYYIAIKDFLGNPQAAVNWMAHMNKKTWMGWNDFMNMITRFREATNCFG